MSSPSPAAASTPRALAVIDRIRRTPPARPGERCELCGAGLDPDAHRHLVDVADRSLRCTCRACALLFDRREAGAGRYRAVPDRWLEVRGFSLDPGSWEELRIPVGIAFIVVSSSTGAASAFYPGPAGATESLLPLGAWASLAAAHRELRALEPDVEAALIRTEPGMRCQVVPVDACYELVGRLRRSWRGFDGGSEARRDLAAFFERVDSRV